MLDSLLKICILAAGLHYSFFVDGPLGQASHRKLTTALTQPLKFAGCLFDKYSAPMQFIWLIFSVGQKNVHVDGAVQSFKFIYKVRDPPSCWPVNQSFLESFDIAKRWKIKTYPNIFISTLLWKVNFQIVNYF